MECFLLVFLPIIYVIDIILQQKLILSSFFFQQPYPAGKVPPALPDAPPAGNPSMSPPPSYNTPGYPEPSGAYPPYPSQDQIYDNNVKPAMPPNPGFNIPDLPAVPTNTLPDLGNTVGSGSAGGEDVDFDDLTKRFEALKKKK